MRQHTPEPWTLERDGIAANNYRLITRRGTFQTPQGREFPYAQGIMLQPYNSLTVNAAEEFEANVRLIAAAPKMAEALREMLSCLGRPVGSDDLKTIGRARALLARINGEG